jgi:protein-L-isoaspartate O-methyltransferase
MHADGRRLEKIQGRLRAMADAVEDGSLPLILSGMKSKAIVEDLMSVNLPTGQFNAPAKKRADNAGLRTQAKWEEARAALASLELAGPTTSPTVEARREFDKLKRDLVGNKGIGIDFFPTPDELAGDLVERGDAQPGDSVLEPSAGSGNITEVMAEIYEGFPDITVTAVEMSSTLVKVLDAQNRANADRHTMQTIQRDFLEYRTKHDVIIGNPPFSGNKDIKHVTHAWELLNPGGRLVMVMSEHAFIANGATETAFRAWLEENGGTADELEPGQLADRKVSQRSNVKGRIVEMNKPGANVPDATVMAEGGVYYTVQAPKAEEQEEKKKLEDAGQIPLFGQLTMFGPVDQPKPKPRKPVKPEDKPRVKQVQTGTFFSATDEVHDIRAAVHVMAPLRKEAQESFMALVTDKSGKILRIIRHSIGSVSGAVVGTGLVAGSAGETEAAEGRASFTDPGVMAGAIAEVPQGTRVWFVHNHPSGGIKQSSADGITLERLVRMLDGTGITVQAGFVVAPGSLEASVVPVIGGVMQAEQNIPIMPGRRNKPIPVTERRLRRIVGRDAPAINNNDLAEAVLRTMPGHDTTGLLLLDHQNRPLKFIPLTGDEMRKMRSGSTKAGAGRLAVEVVQQNASQAILRLDLRDDPELSGMRNLGTALRFMHVQMLDVFLIQQQGGGDPLWTGAVATGLNMRRAEGETFEMAPGVDPENDVEEQSLELVRATIEDAGGTVLIEQDMDGDITLAHVELPKDARGKGTGTRFMLALTAHADRFGRDITLTPADIDLAPSRAVRKQTAERLGKFYGQFQFQWESTRTMMFRTTATTPQPFEGEVTGPGGKTQNIDVGARFKGLLAESELPDVVPPGAPKKPTGGFGVFKAPIAPDKPLRREKILREVERLFGIKIYQGRVKGTRSRLGFYRSHIEELRIRSNNELEVVAHELGHFLDDTDPRFKLAYASRTYKDEVRGLSYDITKLDEGFAEFLRLFLTQEEEAISRAPAFYDEFRRLIEGGRFEKGLLFAQTQMHGWFRQGAINRAEAKLGTDTTFSGRVQDLWFALRELGDRPDDLFIEQTLDDMQGVKVASRTLQPTMADAEVNPYKIMRLVRGVRGVIRSVFNHGTIKLETNGDVTFSGDGLRQIFEPITDVMDDAMSYFAGRRAEELQSQRRENLLKPREIRALIAKGANNPRIVRAFDNYQAFLDRMMDFYEDSGIISQQSRAVIQDLNKSYVPFHRIRELATGESVAPKRAAFRRLFGGMANVNDIYENIMKSTAALIDFAVQNKAKQKVYAMILRGKGASQFAVRIPRDTKVVTVDSAQVAKKLEQILDDLELQLPDGTPIAGMVSGSGTTMFSDAVGDAFGDFMKFFTFGNEPIGNDIDSVMFRGKRMYFQVADPMFLRAMLAFGFRQTNIIIRIMGGFKRTVTFAVTALPDFFIPNLTRDSVAGWLLRRSNMVPVFSSLGGLWDRVRRSDDYWLFMANGGGFAGSIRSETKGARRELENLYSRHGFSMNHVINTPRQLVDWWLEVGSAFEYGTRIAEFKASVKQGKSLQEATFRGRDVSTDFAMRGANEFVRNFVMTVPFMNARMQGAYKLEREGFEKEGKQRIIGERAGHLAARGLIGITIPSVLLWWINQDDDRYNALPDWIKDLHWVIFVPGVEQPWLIMKPFELGAIFATVPERIGQFIKDRDGVEFMDALAFILFEQLGTAPVPQVVNPMLEHARNKNFTGAPIIPDDLRDVDPAEQFKPWSSKTSIFLGQKLGISPVLFDHYVRGYLATLGMYATMASDGLISGQLPEGPAKEWSSRPIIRRFTRSLPLRRTAYEDEFYKLRQEVKLTTNTFNKIKKEQRDPSQYITAEGRAVLFGLRSELGKIEVEIRTINAALRANRFDPGANPAEKRATEKRLIRDRNKLFKSVADVLSPATVRKLRKRLETD